MTKKNILFITFNNIDKPKSGGEQCSLQNYLALREYGNVDVYKIAHQSKFKSFLSIFNFFFPPVSLFNLKEIKSLLKNKQYDILFFDNSLLGRLVKFISKNYKSSNIVFFHNVEYDYVSVRFGKNILKYPYRLLAKINERYSIRYTNHIICLSVRDDLRIYELYRKKCNYIFPITFIDTVKNNNIQLEKEYNNNEIVCLFVGSFIKPNYDGIRWFVDNVLDHLNVKLVIVGKGFELVRSEFEKPNIDLIGTVDDISEYYLMADIIISPIFSGCGMKVKVAEALMYGKNIFGTTEAFSGYEIDYEKVGGLCNSADEFIEKINNYPGFRTKYNIYSRRFFIQKFSHSSLIINYDFLNKI